MNSRVRSTPARGPRLVALLGLHVVEDQRQLPVGANLAGDVEGEVLLVGHRQHQLGVLAVPELEQLVDLVAARPPPQLGGLEDGHQHLLAADRVDLLADDLLDPLHHPVAGGQEVHSPAPSWRISPARTISLCESASASAGSSRRVGRK